MEAPRLEKNYWQKLRNQGLAVLAINAADPVARVRAFRDRHKLTFPVLHDPRGQALSKLGVEIVPTHLVLDRSGRVRHVDTGFDPKRLDSVLRHLLPPA